MNRASSKISDEDIDRIIEMAWEDRTPFEAIELQFGLLNKEVIDLMRAHLSPAGFKRWRRRTDGRSTKHRKLSGTTEARFKSSLQRAITQNKISKR